MKKLFTLMLATLAVCCVACIPLEGGNGGGGNETSFKIYVTNVAATSATITVVPSNNGTYYFDAVDKNLVDAYASKEEFAEDYIETLKAVCEAYGANFGDVLSQGEDSYTHNSLDPSTNYYAIAFGVTAGGLLTTDVSFKAFTTPADAGGSTGGGSTGGGTTGGDRDFSYFTYGYYESFGDYYETGATNWYLDFYTEDTYDVFVVEVQTPLSATSFVGSYPISNSFASGTAVAGGVDADGYIYGSFWGMISEEGTGLTETILLNSGSVNISQSGENYTVKVDALDDAGNKITFNYTGVIEFYDSESSSIAPTAVKGSSKCVARIRKGQKFVKTIPTKIESILKR